MKQFLALIFLYVPHVHTTAQILLAGIADAQSSRKIQYADWISEGGDVLKATQALRELYWNWALLTPHLDGLENNPPRTPLLPFNCKML